MESNRCARRTLAAGEFSLVEQCSCGSVHLTIGAVTLRLAPTAIGPLAQALDEASQMLVRDRTRHLAS